MSHLHQFFGATQVDAFSTADSLRSSPTTCQQQLDTASYWAPALYDGDELVEPTGLKAYYRPGPKVEPAVVEPLPAGLAMIAGDAAATGPQPIGVVGWHCGSSSALSAQPPTCSAASPLALRVTFPDCWDGEHLDVADHTAHLARSSAGRCPGGHPVPIVQLVADIRYPTTGGEDVSLASGGAHTAHADFLNAWDQEKLETEVELCINRNLTCGVVSNRETG